MFRVIQFLARWRKPQRETVISQIQQTEATIMAKLAEIASRLEAVDATLKKASSEIVTEIGNLREALADVDLPAQAETALEAIEASARQLDDIVPDAPAPDAPPAPTE
jgi:DNA anti-recombination protein RmuC